MNDLHTLNFFRLLILFLPVVLLDNANAQSAFIDQRMTNEEAAVLLSKYVSIPSVTGNEKSAGFFLYELCREKGLYVTKITDENDCYNFTASLYPLESGKPNIIL